MGQPARAVRVAARAPSGSEKGLAMAKSKQQPTLLIAGGGRALDAREAAWRSAYPERRIVRVELSAPDQFNYDVSPLRVYAADEHTVFLALGNHAINFSRLKVMGDVKLAGYRMEAFVSPTASTIGPLSPGE